ncbi:MAG: glycosyltransferase [Candidatus Pacebacteria bacterium]|nr:glycosyltransferase [Candidatus Paceibacterota bacterium]
MEITTYISYSLLFIALYTEVYLLLAFLEAKDEVTGFVSHAPLPKVAIIVPCFNEETTVAGTLNSLLKLDYPAHLLSIIAVNDGSSDGTAAILDTFKDIPQITVLTKENGGKHSAMNLALQHTDAEIVGCLDADSYVDASALQASVARFMETGAAAVTPAIVAHTPDNWLRFIQQAEYALSVFMRRAFAASDSVFITPGPFSLFRRDVLTKIGGWKHAHGTEDMEIALRLQEGGYRITNAPKARVFTKTPSTVYALYKQRVRWTYGFIMNAMHYRHMIFNRGYGALGMIVLPTALISIGAAIYFTAMVLVDLVSRLYHFWVKVDVAGFSYSIAAPEWFYVNTTMLALIAYTLIILAVTLLYMGRSLADAKLHPLSVPLYIALYSFLAPWWLIGAVARATVGKQAPWR